MDRRISVPDVPNPAFGFWPKVVDPNAVEVFPNRFPEAVLVGKPGKAVDPVAPDLRPAS